MAIILTQTDTAADNGTNVGCSGATIASTPQAREATEGGTAGATELTPDPSSPNARASVMFQSDAGEPGQANWQAGDYVVRLNVTTSRNNQQWTETYICERTAGGAFNTVASLTGQTTDLSTTGTKTHTVNRGTDFTAAADSTLYVVLVMDSAAAHGGTSFGFTPSLNIDTPIEAAVVTPGTAAFSGTSTFTAAGLRTSHRASSFSGTSTFTAVGLRTVPGSASFTGTSTFTATGTVVKLGSAAFSGVSSFTATGLATFRRTAAFTGVSTFTAAGTATLNRSARFGTELVQLVTFDGTNDYLTRGADLTGVVDGQKGILSAWIKIDPAGDDSVRRILDHSSGRVVFELITSNSFRLELENSAGTLIGRVQSANPYKSVDGVIHVLAAWDLSVPTVQMFINDSDDTAFAIETDDTIDYAGGTNWSVGATNAGILKYNGCIGQLYINFVDYLDPAVQANRRKFITANLTPVYLGSDGSAPTGTAPIMFFDGPVATWETNLGSGGGFTENGALTDCGQIGANSSFTAVGTVLKVRTAAFSGTSTFTAAGTAIKIRSASFSGTSTFTAAGTATLRRSASYSGTSTFTAAGQATFRRAAAYSGTSTFTAVGTVGKFGTASFAGASTFTAAGTKTAVRTASFSGTSAFTAAGLATFRRAAAFTGTSTYTASGTYIPLAGDEADFSGTSSFTASGTLTARRTAAYSGISSFTATGTFISGAAPALRGVSPGRSAGGPGRFPAQRYPRIRVTQFGRGRTEDLEGGEDRPLLRVTTRKRKRKRGRRPRPFAEIQTVEPQLPPSRQILVFDRTGDLIAAEALRSEIERVLAREERRVDEAQRREIEAEEAREREWQDAQAEANRRYEALRAEEEAERLAAEEEERRMAERTAAIRERNRQDEEMILEWVMSQFDEVA